MSSSCQWARPVSGLAPSVGSPRQWACPARPVSGLAPSVGLPRQWARLVSGRFRSAICSRPGLARDTSQASHYGRGVSLVKFLSLPHLHTSSYMSPTCTSCSSLHRHTASCMSCSSIHRHTASCMSCSSMNYTKM